MTAPAPLWVWTPAFAQSREVAGRAPGEVAHTIGYDPGKPAAALQNFRRLGEEGIHEPVIVVDVARFPDDSDWAYVADGINRSGVNPLRGLGALLREPFVDLTRLFHVPAGSKGVVAVFLGARYPGEPADQPVCSYLQEAAILAHTADLPVLGVLVAEAHVAAFDFGQVRPD